jgi:hypothetical protein
MLDDILIERCVCEPSTLFARIDGTVFKQQLLIFQEGARSAQKLEFATSKTLLLTKASATGREK